MMKFSRRFLWPIIFTTTSGILCILLLQWQWFFEPIAFFEERFGGNRIQSSALPLDIPANQHASLLKAPVLERLMTAVVDLPSSLQGRSNTKRRKVENPSSIHYADKGAHRKLKSAASDISASLNLGLETSILSLSRKKKDKSSKKTDKVAEGKAAVTKTTTTTAAAEATEDEQAIPPGSENSMLEKQLAKETLNKALNTTISPGVLKSAPPVPTSTSTTPESAPKTPPVNTAANTAASVSSEEILMGVDENGKPVQMKSSKNSVRIKSGGNAKSKDKKEKSKIPTTITTTTIVDPKNVPMIYSENIPKNIPKNIPENIDPEKELFYMYDLDEEFWWRWPQPGTDCR